MLKNGYMTKAKKLTKNELVLLSKMISTIEKYYGTTSVIDFFAQYGINASSYEKLTCKFFNITTA